MRIEIWARFPKKRKKTTEELQEEEVKRLIGQEDEIDDSPDVYEAEYDFVSLDLMEVADFLRWDNEHTQIIKKNNILYICKIPYRSFKAMYEELTGIKIKKFYNPDIVNK